MAINSSVRAIVLTLLLALALMPGGAAAAGKTILVFGDSLLAGYGLPQSDGFVPQLQNALDAKDAGVTLINGATSGDTTAMGLARLDWALADNPDAVILGLGGNDMLQGLPPEGVRQNLSAMLEKLRALNLPVLLLGMQANRGLGPDYVAAFDPIYADLAKQYGATLYPFFLDGVALDPALNQDDTIHPNAKGVLVIVEKIVPTVLELIGKIGE